MLPTIKRLFGYLKNHKPTFLLGTGLLMSAAFLELTTPLLAKRSLDEVMTPAFQTGKLNLELLLMLLAAYLGINLIGSLFRYISILNLRKMANRIVKEMRDDLFNHMHQLPISYFDQIPAGKIVARITNDTEVLRSNFYVNVLSNMLSNLISIIGVFIAITLLNPYLGAALLILIPILLLWQRFYTKYANRYNLDIREYTSQISGQLNEFVQGMPVIQAFQKESQLLQEFKETVGKWHAAGKKYVFLDSAVAWGFANVLRNGTILAVIIALSSLFLDGRMTLSAGLLYVFIDYINRLFDPIDGMIQIFANIQQSLAAGQRIFAFADEPIEDQSGKELTITQGAVAFHDVSFGYLPDQEVLHQITFTAAPGETVALVGHTGSGKSSILNLLFRFYDPQEGTITIDGQVIKDCNRHSLRKDMAIVLQDPYLFTGTIASNITMGQADINDEQVIAALEKVGAAYLLERYPEGIHHPVVEKGNEFSSGERQLISFARALVFDPKILILDEATSHVDTETEAIIQKAMEVLQEGRTTFMIAHRLSTIKEAQQILVLDKGAIKEQGTHETLLQKEGIYHQMYRMQAEQL